jgi:hypothetical protein
LSPLTAKHLSPPLRAQLNLFLSFLKYQQRAAGRGSAYGCHFPERGRRNFSGSLGKYWRVIRHQCVPGDIGKFL